MTRAGRALIGATLGAVLTLVIHPASRPYLLNVFITPPPPAENSGGGPVTDDLPTMSSWMTAASDRIVSGHPLQPAELEKAISVARNAASLDRDNAFWRQMLAVLSHQRRDERSAQLSWISAAACVRWNDYQSDILLKEARQVARDFGAPQAWQLALVYYARDPAPTMLITQYARSVLASTTLASGEGLRMRGFTVINGGLLSKGAHNIAIGNRGIEISEMASHAGSGSSYSRHRLFLSRIELHNRLRAAGQDGLADQVNHYYREADAWNAIVNIDEAADQASQLSMLSIALASLPSAGLVIVAAGGLAWAIGFAVTRLEHIHWAAASAAGLLLAIGAYAITYLPLAAIATLLCCTFLTLGPKRERKIEAHDLGPMFTFSAGTLALVFALLVAAFVVGLGTPAVSLLPVLEIPKEYFGGSSVLLGLAIIVLAMLMLIAPMFAIALRVGTAFVLSVAFRFFGAFLAWLAMACIVIGTPLSIFMDRQTSDTLHNMVANEPVYYLTLAR